MEQNQYYCNLHYTRASEMNRVTPIVGQPVIMQSLSRRLPKTAMHVLKVRRITQNENFIFYFVSFTKNANAHGKKM